jgi:hypothetical protein
MMDLVSKRNKKPTLIKNLLVLIKAVSENTLQI